LRLPFFLRRGWPSPNSSSLSELMSEPQGKVKKTSLAAGMVYPWGVYYQVNGV
jgi:hypothetical protein